MVVTLLVIVSAASVLLFAAMLTAFACQCILRGMGSIKGTPLPPRWWMKYEEYDAEVYEMHRRLGRE